MLGLHGPLVRVDLRLELYTEVLLLRSGKMACVIDMYVQLLCLYLRCV